MDRLINYSKFSKNLVQFLALSFFIFQPLDGFASLGDRLLFEQFYAMGPQRSSNSVWIQEGTSRQSIEAMREFFPPSYRLLDYKSSPKFIDFLGSEILDPICKSATGQKLCESAFKLLSRRYGVGTMNSTLLSIFTFILYKNGQPAVESWSIGHESWVFIDIEHDTIASLRRRIIHELFQMIDYKNQLLFNPQHLLFEGFSLSCLSMQSLSNRIVRLGTSSLRALAFEELILQELNIKSGKYPWSERSCSEKIKVLEPYIQQISKRLSFEFLKSSEVQIGCNVAPNAISLSDAVLELQSNFQARIKSDLPKQSSQSLCEYLITPDLQVDKVTDELGMDHGPRPRVGDPD